MLQTMTNLKERNYLNNSGTAIFVRCLSLKKFITVKSVIYVLSNMTITVLGCQNV
jgi:hypothetical protein